MLCQVDDLTLNGQPRKQSRCRFIDIAVKDRRRVSRSPKFMSDLWFLRSWKRVVMKPNRLNMTATAGSDVVQSGRPIFDDFSNTCGRISAITRRMLSSKWSSVCGLSA
ncbi:hypothetical protein TNCV_3015611 [Trichonephila clavipes]|nr:hypothetical protein TNCV_3015611 [Trichonephila clavipes]